MPNKVAGYYTTDQSYRSVGSNHLSKIRYDEPNMLLYIEFYNGAKYKYLGVPKGFYDGMMKSNSHGVFFWENIRQKFPYELISNDSHIQPKPIHKPSVPPTTTLFPENKRLDKLDKDEKELNNLFNKGKIDNDEYRIMLYAITIEKDKLIAKLEAKGYFGKEEETQEPSVSSLEVFIGRLGSMATGLWDLTVITCKVIGWGLKQVSLLVGMFFGLMLVLMN